MLVQLTIQHLIKPVLSLLPNILNAFFFLERPFWDLNKCLYLKSLCLFHKYSLTLLDPQFLYLPYEKEAAIMKHTAMKMQKKRKEKKSKEKEKC